MSLSESVKQVIFNQWSFLVGTTFEPTTQGSSNTTYFVDTPDNRFVLKFYAATTETAQIHYEHSLLTFLQSTDRLIEGKGSREKIVDAVAETLRFETWLESNQNQLLDALNFA
jgi:hypothetical protein